MFLFFFNVGFFLIKFGGICDVEIFRCIDIVIYCLIFDLEMFYDGVRILF